MPISEEEKGELLAEERTMLAEERTFLSSIRTVAAIVGLFVIVTKLFIKPSVWSNIAVVMLLIIGLVVVLEEIHLYHKKKKEIERIERMRVK